MTANASRLRFLAEINTRVLPETTDPGFEFRYIDIGSVGRGHLVVEPETMAFEGAPSRARRVIRAGDCLVSTVRTYLRAVLPVRAELDGAIASTGFAVLTPGPRLEPRYLGWVAQSDPFIEEIVARSTGVSYPAINALELGNLEIPTPSIDRQRAIANFLDRETARIDTLIGKKQELLSLLDERWFAEVRERLASLGTDRVKLRHICIVKRGQSPRPIDDPSYFDDEGTHGWVRIEDASRSDMYLTTTTQRLSSKGKARSVPVGPGILLVSIAASVGKPIITAMDCCYHDGWVGLFDLRAVPEFVYFALLLPETFGGLGQVGTQVNINSEIVGNVTIPDVSHGVQKEFVAQVQHSRSHWQATRSAVVRQIDLLAEHRQALVTAAVTGEFKVPVAAA